MKKIYILSEGYSSQSNKGGLEKYLRELYNIVNNEKFYFYEYFSLVTPKLIEKNTYSWVKYYPPFKNEDDYLKMKTFFSTKKIDFSFWPFRTKYTDRYNKVLSANLFNFEMQKSVDNIVLFNTDFSTIELIDPEIFENNECYFVDHGMIEKYFLILKRENQSQFSKPISYLTPLFSYFYKKRLKKLKIKSYTRFNKFSISKKINLVTYTKRDEKVWSKYFDFKNIYIAPLACKNDNDFEGEKIFFNEKEYDISYIGRYSNFQKNIKLLNKIFKKNKNLRGISAGYDFLHLPGESLIKAKNLKNIGYYSGKKIDFFQKSKYSILTSKFEGYGYSLVESIMSETPIIVLDNFPAAKEIVGEKNERGYLAKSPRDMNRWIRKNINNEKLWKEKVNNCIEYKKNNKLYDNFNSVWKEIFDK